LNYRAKAIAEDRQPPEHPTVFLKAPGSVAAHGVHISTPPGRRLEPEAEIAVIVGASCYRTSADDIESRLFGVVAANDVSDRLAQRSGHSLDLAKGGPMFCPMGSWVLPPESMTGGGGLDVQCTVGGRVVQQGNSRDLLHSAVALVHYISQFIELRRGDVVLTGSPAWCSSAVELQPNDVVETRVGSLPPLTFVVAVSLDEIASH
jgi:5-carboxymethyl-2-hydroxymuconate isomerase